LGGNKEGQKKKGKALTTPRGRKRGGFPSAKERGWPGGGEEEPPLLGVVL